MKVLQINTVYPEGSTGKIARGIYTLCCENGIDCKVAYRYQLKNKALQDTIPVSSWWDCHVHNRLVSMTMLQGCFSYFKTLSFLGKVKKFAPDIIHLHNIHGSYINHRLLFRYIKKHHVKAVWTLHDCWSFTGFCPYYDMAQCDKWKHECHHCPQAVGLVDTSKRMHKNKKKWFTGVENMTLVANSEWTAEQARQSFMGGYPIQTIYNGIDLNVFSPAASEIRKTLGCENKYIVLGVAFGWGERKGLDVFIDLSRRLPENYQIILVGTSEETDKLLPKNIISIHRTHNQRELAELYTAADVFANPTREEAFGLVNIEALACGTPGVTFRTGGSPECYDETCGCVVEKNDLDAFEREIIRICETKPYMSESCISYARAFEKDKKFREYIDLYKAIMNK